MTIELHASFADHPGAWLEAGIVEPHGLSITVAAERLGVTQQVMSTLLNGDADLSADMALRFERGSASAPIRSCGSDAA